METTSGAFFLTNCDDQRPIHLQCLDRRAAGGSTPDQVHALPAEMLVPQVAPRMEEGDVLASRRIDGDLPRGFVE